ncbi:zinc finger domain-containing protein [Thioclava atlantica]|uniref:Zinc finger domain-containing protein n=2 Tax=Thioclava atlantica TaxID=1317124 RepID=A0A085TZ34_9RHOB|nr:zinc finger domain-containing protein [Thioclava atlantica]
MLDADVDPVSPDPVPEGWEAEPEVSIPGETEAGPVPQEEQEPAVPESMPEAAPEPEPAEQPHPVAPAQTAPDSGTDESQAEAAVAAMLGDRPRDDADEEELAPAPKPGVTPRKPLDDSLLSILREEAEREAAQRRAEGTSELQTQEEFNLEEREAAADAEKAAALAAERLAQSRKSKLDFSDLNEDYAEEEPEEEEEERVATLISDEEEDPYSIRGRERLPNIDEINSTLTATSDRFGETIAEFSPEMARRRRGGFGAGFLFVILVAAGLAALYFFAPQIAARVPVLKQPLAQYAVAVDEGRIWLDRQLTGMIEYLHPQEGGATPAE